MGKYDIQQLFVPPYRIKYINKFFFFLIIIWTNGNTFVLNRSTLNYRPLIK